MNLRLVFLYIFLIFFGVSSSAQDNNAVSGTIVNKLDKEPLPYASITMKNHAIGTTSNENGEFDFYVPKSMRNDTVSISFIGFNPYFIPFKDIKGTLNVDLQPANNVLDEVVLSNLTPLDYIKKALENLEHNYPQNPYQSLAYYREKFIENNITINKEEGVFKTYYPSPSDTIKNEHQLLLYKPIEDPQQFQFMREWIAEKQEKEKKKADKKGEEYDEEEYDGNVNVNFGGPESVIDLDINHERDNYLNPKHFKKYEYTFGESTSLNGETLITILFKAKKKIDHMKDSGKILISHEDFAIVSIEQTGKFSIPFIVKPILFAVGLKINTPYFSKTINYQKFNSKWYPNLFRWDAKIKLTKRHTFDPNEVSDINIGQVFLINKIDSIGTPIPEEKLFDENEDMENQVYNDIDIQWGELNVIKD